MLPLSRLVLLPHKLELKCECGLRKPAERPELEVTVAAQRNGNCDWHNSSNKGTPSDSSPQSAFIRKDR